MNPGDNELPDNGSGEEKSRMHSGNDRLLKRAAEILSVVFHPVFLPLYGLLIIYSAHTLHSFIPTQVKRMILILVMANNLLMPMALATVLYARGAIKTFNARDRNERVILLSFSLLMYSLTAFILIRMQVPGLFRAFFISIALVTLSTLLITIFYRISLHASGIGGLLVLVVFMASVYNISMVWQAVAVALAAGAVMSSRIYLEDHTPAEVWAGLSAGALIMGLSLFFMLR
jgi:hypothetical protein